MTYLLYAIGILGAVAFFALIAFVWLLLNFMGD